MHPEFESCAHRLRYTLNIRENGAHAECTAFEIMHPALKFCTQGAGCTLHFEHGSVLKQVLSISPVCIKPHILYERLLP